MKLKPHTMKLFELRPKENLPENNDPWQPWYDKSFGFVVRAENEEEARKIADESAGEENYKKRPWLTEEYSTCIELTGEGDSELIMTDFARS